MVGLNERTAGWMVREVPAGITRSGFELRVTGCVGARGIRVASSLVSDSLSDIVGGFRRLTRREAAQNFFEEVVHVLKLVEFLVCWRNFVWYVLPNLRAQPSLYIRVQAHREYRPDQRTGRGLVARRHEVHKLIALGQ
jgi:hypothetical protein